MVNGDYYVTRLRLLQTGLVCFKKKTLHSVTVGHWQTVCAQFLDPRLNKNTVLNFLFKIFKVMWALKAIVCYMLHNAVCQCCTHKCNKNVMSQVLMRA